MRNKLAHSGLTLVELLVAISVLGFVAILGWRGLDGIVRARISLTNDMEQTRGLQLTFAQLQSDCAHLASPAILPNRQPLVVGQGRLSLVRTVFADQQPTRLQVITYRISDGVLTRNESIATRNLNELDNLLLTSATDFDSTQTSAYSQTVKLQAVKFQTVKLKSGVDAMTLRVWSEGSWRAIDLNAPTAPPSSLTHPVIPTGLEVGLRLNGRDNGMLKIFMLGAV